MIIRSFDNTIIIFGGEDESGKETNQLYRLDFPTASWSRIAPLSIIAPPARHSHAAVYYQDSLFVAGGMLGQFAYCDAWRFEFSSLEWSEVTLDTQICRGRASFAAVGNLLFVYGGIDQTYNIVDAFLTINVCWISKRLDG
jgi:hypothetical protein